MNVKKIQATLEEFAKQRDWNKFHTPKNLAVALAVEASELLEVFQWLTDDESKTIANSDKDMELIRDELADIQIYLLRLAYKLNINIETAVESKLIKNALKYPVELSKGNAVKYNRRDK